MNRAIREGAGRVVESKSGLELEDVEMGPLTQEEMFPWESARDVLEAQQRELNREIRERGYGGES
jgi:hypothetical protein